MTLLHWNHLRARRSISWREISTVSERETLAFLCGDWLLENGYETDMSWIRSPGVAPGNGPADRLAWAATEPYGLQAHWPPQRPAADNRQQLRVSGSS